VLKYDADAGAQGARLSGELLAAEPEDAEVGAQDARQATQERALAGAVRAEQAEDLAAAHLKADVVEDDALLQRQRDAAHGEARLLGRVVEIEGCDGIEQGLLCAHK